MNEQINKSLEIAREYADMADKANTFERTNVYSLTSIAYSLFAIAKMFATDYEKEFGGD